MEESKPFITAKESLPQNIPKAILFDCTSVMDLAISVEGRQKNL